MSVQILESRSDTHHEFRSEPGRTARDKNATALAQPSESTSQSRRNLYRCDCRNRAYIILGGNRASESKLERTSWLQELRIRQQLNIFVRGQSGRNHGACD